MNSDNWTMRLAAALGAGGCVLAAASPALATDKVYALARDHGADNGISTSRAMEGTVCDSSPHAGDSFVFHDMWQGTGLNDDGWLEVGTSYCDGTVGGIQGAGAKWVWAEQPSGGSYTEAEISGTPPGLGVRVNFKISNTNSSIWGIFVNGTLRKTSHLHVNGGNGNTADIGLEILNNGDAEVDSHSNPDHLRRTTYSGGWTSGYTTDCGYNTNDPGGDLAADLLAVDNFRYRYNDGSFSNDC